MAIPTLAHHIELASRRRRVAAPLPRDSAPAPTATARAAETPPPPPALDWFGLHMARLTMEQAVERVDAMLRSGRPHHVTVVNSAVAVWCRWDPRFGAVVRGADLVLCDGMGFMYASRLLGAPFPEMLSGPLLMERLVAHAAERGASVYFLGSTRRAVSEAVRRFRIRYPRLRVAGLRDGYFAAKEQDAVVDEVRRSGAGLLFVAMGSPREEDFIHDRLADLGAAVCVDVGGAFEVAAGIKQLAPRWVRVAALEWAYRLWQEPRRLWKRYATTLPVFLFLVALAAVRTWGRRVAVFVTPRRAS